MGLTTRRSPSHADALLDEQDRTGRVHHDRNGDQDHDRQQDDQRQNREHDIEKTLAEEVQLAVVVDGQCDDRRRRRNPRASLDPMEERELVADACVSH